MYEFQFLFIYVEIMLLLSFNLIVFVYYFLNIFVSFVITFILSKKDNLFFNTQH